jgi:hypothetical protein
MQNKKKLEIHKFLNKGYLVIKILNKHEHLKLKEDVIKRINNKIKKIDFFSVKNINLYHTLIKEDSIHKKLISSNRYVELDKKIKSKISKNKIINTVLKKYWGHNKFIIKWIGSSLKKNQIKDNFCGFRISRPIKTKKQDTAGAHCDIHVGGRISSDMKIMITAWIPLEGFSKKYTLQLYEKSHHKLHPLNNIKKRKNTVSRIFNKSYLKRFKSKRLNLKPGEAILIHPNLIHGGGENLGNNSRLSVEIRVYNTKNIIKYPVSLKG